jgi:CHASE1-domain containing sensor protein
MAAVISLLVVAIGVVTAYLFSSSLSTQAELERTNLLSQQSSGFTTYIQERAANYEQVLLSAAGLIKVHNLDNITATDWTTLITSLQLRRLHPELLSMGLVKGTVLTYAEVFEEGRPANLGYDFASEPIRLQTIELARDNAQTTVTPPVVLRTDAQSANDTAPYHCMFQQSQ